MKRRNRAATGVPARAPSQPIGSSAIAQRSRPCVRGAADGRRWPPVRVPVEGYALAPQREGLAVDARARPAAS